MKYTQIRLGISERHTSHQMCVFNMFEDVYVVLRPREPDDACAIVNGGIDHSQFL